MIENSDVHGFLGEFELLRELGRGGMGIVYEARQPSLNRKVALKVIRGGLSGSSSVVQRFQREAEAAGRLKHPNIVPVYSTGHQNGTHFYAMELVEGPSLDDVISDLRVGGVMQAVDSGSTAIVNCPAPNDETELVGAAPVEDSGPVAPREHGPSRLGWVFEELGAHDSASIGRSYFDTIARLIAGVALGLEYAHEKGVIHRDIKPANLLLARDGRLGINDFGLARTLEQPGLTASGEFVGSPMYMAPEQVSAGRTPLDHRADIYSLGATLYQLLTLEPPAEGTTRDEVLANLLHREPIRPRKHRPRIPVDLETICLKAMERDPNRRYQSGGDFSRDLLRYVDRETVSARRIGSVERAWRWSVRHRALSASSLIAIVLTFVGLFLYFENRSERLQRSGEAALVAAWNGDLTSAEEFVREAESLGASKSWVLMTRGQVDLFGGKTGPAIEKLKQAVNVSTSRGVSERALLANAHFQNGEWYEFRRIMAGLKGEALLTPDDRLFYGWGSTWNDPQHAVEILEKAAKERFHSPIPRVVHSIALSQLALQQGDPAWARKALRSASVARAFIENDGGLANGAELFSLLALASTEPSKRTVHLESARTVVADPVDSVDLPMKLHWRVHYLLATKKFDEAMQAYEGDAKRGHNVLGFFVWPYYAAAVGSGQFARAHEFLETLVSSRPRSARVDVDVELVRAFLATALDTEESRKLAWEIYRALLGKLDSGELAVESCSIVLLIPSFLGDRAEAEASSRRYVDDIRAEVTGDWSWPRYTAENLAGTLDDAELLQSVTLEKSRAQYGEMQYWLGMIKLSRRDRPGALRCFERSVASGVFNFHGPTAANGFLAHMARHEAWPEWLDE